MMNYMNIEYYAELMDYKETYLKKVRKRYPFSNILFVALIVCLVVYSFDILNVATSFWALVQRSMNGSWMFVVLVAVLCVVLMLSKSTEDKIWLFFWGQTIDYIDKFLCALFLALCLMLVGYTLMLVQQEVQQWKIFLLLCLLTCDLYLIKIRIYRLNKGMTSAENKKQSSHTLAELYQGKIKERVLKDKGIILLEDQAIQQPHEDLLEIMPFATSMKNMLLQFAPKESYTISLTGKWGSGKTSIINLLQSQMNAVDNNAMLRMFNPWEYEDTYTLFKAFFNLVFHGLDGHVSYLKYKEYLRTYQALLFGYVENKIGFSFANIVDDKKRKDIAQMRQRINDRILLGDQKLIIVIDNIDRLEKEQILFIFKMITTILNFNSVIYVLCFDETRVKNLFETELYIDVEYLDKIIQTKITLPQIKQETITDIGKKSLYNLLEMYDMRVEDAKRFNVILNLIFKNVRDLRDVTRFLNGISGQLKVLQESKLPLDVGDFIALEYVKYVDIELYYQLSQHGQFLISDYRGHYEEYDDKLNVLNENDFAIKVAERFQRLFEGKEQLLELLTEIFPQINAYYRGEQIQKGRYRQDARTSDKVSKAFIKQRAYNGSFFQAYFTQRNNEYTTFNQRIERFIEDLNFINVSEPRKIDLENLVGGISPRDQGFVLKIMNTRLDEVNDLDKLFGVILAQDDLYQYKSITILLVSIIKKEPTQAIKYLNALAEKDLRVLGRILDQLEVLSEHEQYAVFYEHGNELMRKKLKQMLEEKQDFFKKGTYKHRYSGLYHPKYLVEFAEKEEAITYINSLINPENVFRVVADGIDDSVVLSEDAFIYNYVGLPSRLTSETVGRILPAVYYELNRDQQKIKQLYDAKGESIIFNEPINFDNL